MPKRKKTTKKATKKTTKPAKKKTGAKKTLLTKKELEEGRTKTVDLFHDIAEATMEDKAIYPFHAKQRYFDSLHEQGLIKHGGKGRKGWVLSKKGERLYDEMDI